MNRLTKYFVFVLALTPLSSTLAAPPPAPPKPTPPPIRILPSVPRPTPPIIVRPTGSINVYPSTLTLRPVVTVAPVVTGRYIYSIYFRAGPFDPWTLFGSSYSFWRAEEISDQLAYFYGYETLIH